MLFGCFSNIMLDNVIIGIYTNFNHQIKITAVQLQFSVLLKLLCL